MIIQHSTNGCGNTLRVALQQNSDRSGGVYVNEQIILATDGQKNYSEGQPLYQASASCDPSRNGAPNPTCCP